MLRACSVPSPATVERVGSGGEDSVSFEENIQESAHEGQNICEAGSGALLQPQSKND